jgi:hypothetical protein
MAAGTRDVEKFVPDLVQALAKPSEMPETLITLIGPPSSFAARPP